MTSSETAGAVLTRVLSAIAERPDCHVLAPERSVAVPRSVALPDDLQQFYELCGGVLLFDTASFPRRVCGPDAFVPASPRLLTPEIARRVADDDPADLTNNCFVIVDGGRGLSTEPHVVMDLAAQRAGHCYAAYWDTYGLVGEMPVVATTVAELLQALLTAGGNEAMPTGILNRDAYDG